MFNAIVSVVICVDCLRVIGVVCILRFSTKSHDFWTTTRRIGAVVEGPSTRSPVLRNGTGVKTLHAGFFFPTVVVAETSRTLLRRSVSPAVAAFQR